MYCQNRMVHTVQEGDTVSPCETVPHNRHGTDTRKSGVNPYNLQVGMKLYVCPGKATYRPREAAQTPGTRETAEAPGTPVMLEMVEIPVMPAWAETSVSEW